MEKHLGVEFIYEGKPGDRPAAHVGVESDYAEPKKEDALNRLPAKWLADLFSATVNADQEKMLELINQIRDDFPDFADGLSGLAEDYEYKQITAMLERSGRLQ